MRIGRRDNPIFEMDSLYFSLLILFMLLIAASVAESYIKAKYKGNSSVTQQIQGGVGENPPYK